MDTNYYELIRNYLLLKLFGKQVFTFPRSWGYFDTVNDFDKARDIINYGETIFAGKNYSITINWHFPPETMGEEDKETDPSIIRIKFCNLMGNISVGEFKTFINDFLNHCEQLAVKDNHTGLEVINDAANMCEKFMDIKYFNKTGIYIFRKDCLKEETKNNKDYGAYMDTILPFIIFKNYFLKGNATDILSYVRKHDFANIIATFEDIKFSFEGIILTNEVLETIAKTFKCKNLAFKSCIIPEDSNFSVLKNRNISFIGMNINMYQLTEIKEALEFHNCNINTTIGISQNIFASKMLFKNCDIDFKKLCLLYNAKLLKELEFYGSDEPKTNEFNFLPYFAENLETFNFYGNLYDFEFFTRFKNLSTISINGNYYAGALIIASKYDPNVLKARNKHIIEAYYKNQAEEYFSNDYLPYFELYRIKKLLRFYQKISSNEKDYELLMKLKSIYPYLLFSKEKPFDRGFHVYNGALSFCNWSLEELNYHEIITPRDLDDPKDNSDDTDKERVLVLVGNYVGSKLKYPFDPEKEIYHGIGPLIYYCDGRPIIFQRNYLTGEFNKNTAELIIYGQSLGKELEITFGDYTSLLSYLDHATEKIKEKGIREIKYYIDEDISLVEKYINYINVAYKDTMPEYCKCFNEYYNLLLDEQNNKPGLPKNEPKMFDIQKLCRIVYNKINQLSLAELTYIYLKCFSLISSNYIKGAIEKYGCPVDLEHINVDNINETLGFDLDLYFQNHEQEKKTISQKSCDTEGRKDVIMTSEALMELSRLPDNEEVIHEYGPPQKVKK